MGTAKTEGRHAGEFLISEAPGNRSRETVTIASGQDLPACQVLGKITSGGEYAEYNNGAIDGTQVAAGILIYAIDASDGDVIASVIDCDAEVNGNALEWGSQSGSSITAAVADLLARGIKVRY